MNGVKNMTNLLSVSIAVLAVAAGSGGDAVARPFTDPRSDRRRKNAN